MLREAAFLVLVAVVARSASGEDPVLDADLEALFTSDAPFDNVDNVDLAVEKLGNPSTKPRVSHDSNSCFEYNIGLGPLYPYQWLFLHYHWFTIKLLKRPGAPDTMPQTQVDDAWAKCKAGSDLFAQLATTSLSPQFGGILTEQIGGQHSKDRKTLLESNCVVKVLDGQMHIAAKLPKCDPWAWGRCFLYTRNSKNTKCRLENRCHQKTMEMFLCSREKGFDSKKDPAQNGNDYRRIDGGDNEKEDRCSTCHPTDDMYTPEGRCGAAAGHPQNAAAAASDIEVNDELDEIDALFELLQLGEVEDSDATALTSTTFDPAAIFGAFMATHPALAKQNDELPDTAVRIMGSNTQLLRDYLAKSHPNLASTFSFFQNQGTSFFQEINIADLKTVTASGLAKLLSPMSLWDSWLIEIVRQKSARALAKLHKNGKSKKIEKETRKIKEEENKLIAEIQNSQDEEAKFRRLRSINVQFTNEAKIFYTWFSHRFFQHTGPFPPPPCPPSSALQNNLQLDEGSHLEMHCSHHCAQGPVVNTDCYFTCLQSAFP